MRQFVCQYDTPQSFVQWLNSHTISDTDSLLIQIFSGVLDVKIIHSLTQTIEEELPQAIIIGATTSGEIMDGKMHDESIVVSMSIFEKTNLKSMHIIDNNFEMMGHQIANTLIRKDTKCIIIFADGLKCKAEAILSSLNSSCSQDIVIAGGMAGDNMRFKKSYCIHGNDIFEKGVVAVSLSSPDLEVFRTCNLSWKPIGKKMIITKSKGNILYELDNQPVKEVYSKYLGEGVLHKMPASATKFPLIMNEDDVDIARSMIDIGDDGGITYAGDVPEGKKVRFGVGSPGMLVESAYETYNLARKSPIEGLFVYSCSARKAFLGKALESEFSPLLQISSLCGFFTYGEFYHATNSNKLLNVTTTVLGLSETKNIKNVLKLEEEDFTYSNLTFKALMNLVEVTQEENETYVKELKNQAIQIQSYLDISQVLIMALDNEKNVIMINQEGADILGYTKEEIIGKNWIDNFLPKRVRADIDHIGDSLLQKQDEHTRYENPVLTRSGEERIILWKNSTLLDNEGKVMGILTSGEDITEKKEREKQLLLHTRHAQMGEMIAMIAHQWRQPLAAIAASISTLQLKQVLDEYDKDYYDRQLENMEGYTQHLSQTIEDFRNFFKEDKKQINIRLSDLIEGAISIVKPTFINKGIELIINHSHDAEVSTYPNELKQVILNILKNSQEGIEERKIKNGKIEIKTSKENDEYHISIQDNSGGIPEEIIDHIFEPYFTTKEGRNGTGLGLYMSKIIIQEHCKGHIKIYNYDKGTLCLISIKKSI